MRPKREKGAILIITLWILAILAILSVGVAGRMGLELKLTGYYRDNMRALYLGKAGISRAAAVVGLRSETVNSLKEAWSNNPEDEDPLFKGIEVADTGTFTVSYPFSEDRIFYGIQDEERRININNAPKEAIRRLIEYLNPDIGDASEISAAIEDWRDADAIRKDGAPEYDYSSEGYPRKDGYFDVAEEVLLVSGMTPEIFNNIKDYITVYPGTQGRLNVNTANAAALFALGLSADTAQAVITARAGDDGIEGTADDVPFTNQGEFNTFLNAQGATLPPESVDLPAIKSSYFRIISCGETGDKKGRKTLTCVIGPHPTEQREQVLFWSEE